MISPSVEERGVFKWKNLNILFLWIESFLNPRGFWSVVSVTPFISPFVVIPFLTVIIFFTAFRNDVVVLVSLAVIPWVSLFTRYRFFNVDNGSGLWLSGVNDWDWNLSQKWNFLSKWYWNWYSSGERNSSVVWILNVVNVILLVVFLNNWLSDDLLSWNSDSLLSDYVINDWLFVNIVQLNLLVSSSVDLEIDVFSLNNWLNELFSVDFFSWSFDGF